MVKQHMSSIDVAAQVACLNSKLLGLRVANIYDLNAKTYMLKLSKSGGEGDKVFLVLESGVRFHTTQVLKDKSDIPSNFSLKLRKHVRTKRLESVRQLGVDRIVDFTFGSGEAAVHLILEMYAQGNIVLTDSKYEVLTLLRSHRDDDKGFAVMARHPYPMDHVRLRTRVTSKHVLEAAQACQPGMNLKGLVAQVLGYGPAIAEHVIRDADLDPFTQVTAPQQNSAKATSDKKAAKKSEGDVDDDDKVEGGAQDDNVEGEEVAQPAVVTLQLTGEQEASLDQAFARLDDWFASLETSAPPGYITCLPPGGKKKNKDKGKKQQQQAAPSADNTSQQQQEGGNADHPVVYDEFHPVLMHQVRDLKSIEFGTFDEAVEEFFGKIEGQRADMAKAEAERSAMSKLDKIKSDQTARAAALAKEAEEAELRASLIQYNLEAVDAVITALNESLASGMDWHDLERLIKDERKSGNPVAQYIHSLQLDQNKATLLLSNYLDEEEEGDEDANARKATKVTVDLGLTAHANAAQHFDSRKKHLVKQAKTLAANEAALKAAEKKAAAAVSKVRSAPAAAVARKPHWFERFNWFISSENFLVISGRDAQQNELIVKRYFRKGDVYVHADLHGASSTIIKNPNPEEPVPPLTLQQAGCACVCRSRAWDSKIVTSAWWVSHHQVSKTAPTGEYLPTGSFMIRGKKNFLPPQPLVFGFGFMFKLEPGSIAAHVGERAVRTGAETDMLSMALTNMDMGGAGDDIDVSEMDLGLPDVPEADEEQASALDRFMSGTYTASSGTAPASVRLNKAALAAVGGTTTTSDLAAQYQRYGLDIEDPETEIHVTGLPENAPAGAGQPGKAGAGRQQQAQGKGGKPAAGNNNTKGTPQIDSSKKGGAGGKAQDTDKKGSAGNAPACAKSVNQQQQQQQQAVRGKKGKQQKMKDKYADQDEEEKQLAVALLASAGDKKTRADRRKDRKDKKEAARQAALGTVLKDADTMAAAIAAATRKQYGKDADAAQQAGDDDNDDASDSNSEEASQQERETSQEPSTTAAVGASQVGVAPGPASPPANEGTADDAQQQGAGGVDEGEDDGGDAEPDTAGLSAQEKAEIAALLAEENQAELGDEEKEKLTVLDSLTGVPTTEDLLLFAVPVCGPYNALQNYKYKVKLTPGTVKKGKAARQAQELLSRALDIVQREKELMKAVPDMDMINAMVGTSKLSMPGLAKLKAGEKAAKKSAAKAKNQS